MAIPLYHPIADDFITTRRRCNLDAFLFVAGPTSVDVASIPKESTVIRVATR